MDGILNIRKEKGFTSHDVVAIIRKIAEQKKVGHTGTLDPDAEGVLPVCLGKATKLVEYITAEKKRYVATLKLGYTTDTQDGAGKILSEKPVDFDKDNIARVTQSFIGDIKQTPPMYSAIKINGKKLYALAREGKEIERKKRDITIYDIKILEFLPPDRVKIDVICSKGTYIRTLCADIGDALGCGAYMAELLRTESGNFTLDTAFTLNELKALKEENRLAEAIIPMEKVLSAYPRVDAAKAAEKILRNGGKIKKSYFSSRASLICGQTVAAFDYIGNIVGLYVVCEQENEVYIKPLKMLI